DGQRLISAGWDTTARVWGTGTGKPIILLNDHATQVHALALSAPLGQRKSARLASADSAYTVHLWDLDSYQSLAVFSAHGAEVRALGFSPGGHLLASGGNGHMIHLWDAQRGPAPESEPDPALLRPGVALSRDGARLASVGPATALRVWEVASGTGVV